MNPMFLILAAAGAVAYLLNEDSKSPQQAPATATGNNDGQNGAAAGDAENETQTQTTESEEVNRTPEYEAFVTAYAQTPFHNLIASTETKYGIPQNLLARLLYQESGFDPGAVGDEGAALGIAQFHEGAARDMGINPQDRINPVIQIPAAGRYLAGLFRTTGKDWRAALVAYNWGIGSVRNYGVDSAPESALAYADTIMADSELA